MDLIMKLFKKIKDIIKSTILCIRFPFLYPRNRWDGEHHTNLLLNLSSKLRKKAQQEIHIVVKLDKTGERYYDKIDFFDYKVRLDKTNEKLTIKNKLDSLEIDLPGIIWKSNTFEILGVKLDFAWVSGDPVVVVYVTPMDPEDKTNYGFGGRYKSLVISKWYNFWYKVVDWIDEKVLDKIFFLPSYTELDAMDAGWRKAFGIQMCKEIKAELKKHKFLYKYRIVQIKEKWGYLHWYDGGVPKDSKIWDIIHKYEDISRKTCVVCGKPATKMSTGWISPYCDNCIGDKQFTEIKDA